MTELRTGFTTGACASAAAKAAAALLVTGERLDEVEIPLPGGERVTLPVERVERLDGGARAAVIKDAGDDPDITNGAQVVVEFHPSADGDITFEAGEGVGVVTKPGLSIPPGEAAINPVPRTMIAAAVREVTGAPALVRVSVPGGEALARKTFNPRLGVHGGLSILGTTGIVRPYSCPALRQSIVCALEVALASGVTAPVFTPGNIGTKAARELLGVDENRIVEVSNEWGFMIDAATERGIAALLAVGHPGKLAKLAQGKWDTHSKRSESAAGFVAALADEVTGAAPPPSETVEGVFMALDKNERRTLGDNLAGKIARAVERRARNEFPVTVALVSMAHELLGLHGDASR